MCPLMVKKKQKQKTHKKPTPPPPQKKPSRQSLLSEAFNLGRGERLQPLGGLSSGRASGGAELSEKEIRL